MGERSINTILRLNNESEYRAALKGCNQELKNLKSQLDLTSSEFRNNANSMEALSAKNQVLSKMYTTQTEKIATLRGALDNAEKTREREKNTLSELDKQYKEAKKTLDSYGDEVDKNSEEYKNAKAEVDKLANSIYAHQVKLDASQVSIDKYSTQLNRATIELNDTRDRQIEVNRLLDEAKASADGCATSIDRYGDAVHDAADGTGKSASAVEALASTMVASGVQQKVEDLAAAMMKCSEASQEYGLSVASVGTIADKTLTSNEALHDEILILSKDLRKDANDVADAAYEALSSGVKTAEVMSFTAQSSKLATAGYTQVSTSVDVLTTILNAYKMEADQTEKVASTLVKTQDLGKVKVDELAGVLGRIIPTAAAYRVDLDNIATAYANMTAAGINAENTTTYVSAMLDELADGGSKVAAILRDQTGKSFAELMADGNSLGDVLEVIGRSVEYDNVQFSNLWSSSTAGKAAISLFDGSAEKFNKTLNQMINSSGTLAKNYEALTSVSAYSSQRVETASKNLTIVVGDQLNPVLDKLRNAGAGVLETATQAVSENPALVALITGIVTAVGLLSAGLTGLAVVQAITPLFAAFNAVLAANPVAIVAIGVVSLGAAIATFASQCKDANADLEALTEASRNLSDTVSAGNQSYADTVTSVNAAVDTVDSYIQRLEELEAQGLKTKEQEMEYSLILDQINATIPELNASIDEQTGLLKGGTAALMEQANQWKQTAIQEAAYTRYKEDIQALTDAQYEASKNQILLNDAQKRGEIINQQLSEALSQQAYWHDQVANATKRDDETYEQFESRCRSMGNTMDAYDGIVRDLLTAQSENTKQTEDYEEALRIANETIAEQQPLVDAATEAIEGYGEQVKKTGENVEAGTAEYAQNATDSLSQVSEEYRRLRDAARNSLETQFGLFDEAKIKTDMSTRDMINNLKSQRDAFNSYADNITLAMERGIDMGLVQKLSDGTTESMAYLAQLVTATDEEIAEINAAWLDLAGGKDNAETAMTTVEGTILGVLNKITDEAYSKGHLLGTNIGDGAIAGLESRIKDYASVATRFSDAGFQAVRVRDDTHSPSRRWMWLGDMEGEGIITAHKKMIPKVEASSTALADANYSAAIRARQRSFSSMTSVATQQTSAGIGTEVVPLLKQLLTAVKEGKILTVNGRSMVAATADEYDNQMGQRRFLVERGAK